MTWLLTGASGMLGSAFAESLGSQAVLLTRAELDVTDAKGVFAAVESRSPRVVINCAAHVDAEAAEHDADGSYRANAVLPGLLAQACRRVDAKLVHFSSTGCYGSWKAEPYTEEDPPAPTTVHHRSKLAGERQVIESGCEHLILRTGWLFGGSAGHKKNFVWRRLLEAAAKTRIESDAAQGGNPTYVEDVVRQTLALLDLGVNGVFNCVARGSATRFDYVARIVASAGLPCVVSPRGAFVRAAPVSANEAAINYRLQLLQADLMPEWTGGVDRYVAAVRQWDEYKRLIQREVVLDH